MRILVTGGAGFIGSHLCDYLLDKGHTVICADNFITGNRKNIKHNLKNKSFKFIKQDVIKPFTVSGKLDAVMHFASPASPVDYLEKPLETLQAGSIAAHNLLDLAKKKKAVFFLASTSEVYGDPKEHPQSETYWGNVNPIGPRSVYDEAKRYAEAVTMAYHRYYKLNTKIVRIFNTYGERMKADDGRAIPNFICQALRGKPFTVFGSGSQTRSFCYVKDLVRGIYKLLLSKEVKPVNLGNPIEMSLKELALYIKKLTKSKSKIIYKSLPIDDPKVRRPNISKAKKILEWRPSVNIEEGLNRTINWFAKNIKY
ncbi:UDP-glucuronic acid decarboxylase family protein [bacterium]